MAEMTHTYRNKKTGATFTTTSVCNGENWEEIAHDGAAENAPDGGVPSPKGKKNG